MEAFLQPRDGHRHHFQKHQRKTPPERRVTRGKLVDHETGGKVLQWRGGGESTCGCSSSESLFSQTMQRRRGFRPAASEPGPQGPQSGFSVLPGRARLSSRCKAGKRFPPGRSEAPERTGVRRPRFRQRKLSHNCCWHLCLEDTCKSLLQITKKL